MGRLPPAEPRITARPQEVSRSAVVCNSIRFKYLQTMDVRTGIARLDLINGSFQGRAIPPDGPKATVFSVGISLPPLGRAKCSDSYSLVTLHRLRATKNVQGRVFPIGRKLFPRRA
jgi:hypothetical protein